MNTLTWIKSAHTLRSGLLVTRNRKDQNGRFEHTGAVNFNPSGNPSSTGLAFADALLGNFRTYSEGATIRSGSSASRSTAASSRTPGVCRTNLSLEMGLRYEFAAVRSTRRATTSRNFDPALYDPSGDSC